MPVTRPLSMLALLLFACSAASQSQQAIRDQLLGEADAAKQAADALDARILAPESYAKGLDAYVSASEALEKGRDMDRVRSAAAEAGEHFQRSSDAAKLAQVTFASTLSAREAAEKADAARLVERDWSRAEESLMDAARTLEDGNLNKAARGSAAAAERYRDAESRALTAQARGRSRS